MDEPPRPAAPAALAASARALSPTNPLTRAAAKKKRECQNNAPATWTTAADRAHVPVTASDRAPSSLEAEEGGVRPPTGAGREGERRMAILTGARRGEERRGASAVRRLVFPHTHARRGDLASARAVGAQQLSRACVRWGSSTRIGRVPYSVFVGRLVFVCVIWRRQRKNRNGHWLQA